MNITRKLIIILCMVFAIVMFHGCSAKQADAVKNSETEELIWPLPPEKARYKFVEAIYGERQYLDDGKTFKDKLLGDDPELKYRSFMFPHGIAVDSKNRLIVADPGYKIVFVIDRDNRSVIYLGEKGRAQLIHPIGVAVDKEDNIYVADANGKVVYGYRPDGTPFLSLNGPKGDEFIRPTGVAVDSENNHLYVVDTKGHVVHVYNLQGDYVAKIGGRGSQPELFNFPIHAAVDSIGKLYITDFMNFRVQVFDADLNFVGVIGEMGAFPGQFRKPKSVALDSEDNVYVLDSEFNNFQVFNQNFEVLMHVGSIGKDIGKFWLPTFIYVDRREDKVYVSDYQNRRIQVFQFLGGE